MGQTNDQFTKHHVCWYGINFIISLIGIMLGWLFNCILVIIYWIIHGVWSCVGIGFYAVSDKPVVDEKKKQEQEQKNE